jgi:hypothetical protein
MAVKRGRRDVGRGNGTRVGGHCHWGGGAGGGPRGGGRRLEGEEKPGKGEAERSLVGMPSVPQLRPP